MATTSKYTARECFDAAHSSLPGVLHVPLQYFFAHPDYRHRLTEGVDELLKCVQEFQQESFKAATKGEKVIDLLEQAYEYAELGALKKVFELARASERLMRDEGETGIRYCALVGLLVDECRRQDFNRKRNIGRFMLSVSDVSVARKAARDERKLLSGFVEESAERPVAIRKAV